MRLRSNMPFGIPENTQEIRLFCTKCRHSLNVLKMKIRYVPMRITIFLRLLFRKNSGSTENGGILQQCTRPSWLKRRSTLVNFLRVHEKGNRLHRVGENGVGASEAAV